MEGKSDRLSLSKRKRRQRKKKIKKKICPKAFLKHQGEKQEEISVCESDIGSSDKREPIDIVEILSSDEEDICMADHESVKEDSNECINEDENITKEDEPDELPNKSEECKIIEDLSTNDEKSSKNDVANEVHEKKPVMLTYKTSAYTQNLAEISYDILHDARWRTCNKRLFQWEFGDDLSILQSFSRLFILPESENHSEGHREDSAFVDSVKDDESENDDLFARCMHLYARLFHRKGPWFHMLDIFIRYYHRDYFHRQDLEKNASNHAHNATPNGNVQTTAMSWDILEKRLKECMLDLCRLQQIGAIRTFVSEEECGEVVGMQDSNLLTENDKLKVLRKLGGKPSKDSQRNGRRNDILKQMKSQTMLAFHMKGSKMRAQKYVNETMLDSFALKLNMMVNEKINGDSRATRANGRQKSTEEVKKLLERLWLSISDVIDIKIPLFTCFRPREQPLSTLRRACRLYICAGDGPGSMRWSGSNAWLTTIESTDTFISQRYEEKALLKGICHLPDPPTTRLWHQVSFSGLANRMGLNFCAFNENYKRIRAAGPHDNRRTDYRKNMVELFSKQQQFQTWELCAEIRCITDYLTEWNRLILYADRKMIAASKKNGSMLKDIKELLSPCISEKIDVLSVEGRSALCSKFAIFCTGEEGFSSKIEDTLKERVENDIYSLHPISEDQPGKEQIMEDGDSFVTDAERMICSIGIICSNVLLIRMGNISPNEAEHFVNRPWLRHLQSESVLAYIVWDCVETLEKRGYHCLASQMLEIILFGFFCMDSSWKYESYNRKMQENVTITNISQILLSRRVRGKAFERLLIDKKHASRKKKREKKSKKKAAKAKKICDVDTFTADCLHTIVSTASIPFSFIRKFTRRIKVPLIRSVENAWSVESLELGIRLVHDRDSLHKKTEKKSSYAVKEWEPIVDTSIANAIQHDSNANVGKRCAFVSHDDRIELTRSLNVEELAIEEYAAGRLPSDKTHKMHSICKGKWKGWHCEGAHVRVLFRVLCCSILLGNQKSDDEQSTVFLHPYQAAPLDLHVAHSIFQENNDSTLSPSGPIRSFYERRKIEIERFLKKLEESSPQELCDLVYTAVKERIDIVRKSGRNFTKDPVLCRDLQEVRTLSMLAAGFGGRLLASMFRSLSFDYRHYCAGLPDLLLVRAFVNEAISETCEIRPLDLAEWIGEIFQHSRSSSSAILEDRDEELLGASLDEKQSYSSSNQRRNVDANGEGLQMSDPERLLLLHNGAKVTVDCMFVEVKSQNDRLNERQEDWLNILDRFGSARVCKFTSSKTISSKTR